jgi:WXG100 family type VII secretion target
MMDVNGALVQVPENLGELHMQIRNTATHITDMLTSLNSNLQALKGFWMGKASEGHTTVHQEWATAEQNLLSEVGTLGNLGHTTLANWNNYVDAETTNAQSWAH